MSDKIICDQCRTPIAELTEDGVVIRSKHHGEEHITVLDPVELYARWIIYNIENTKSIVYNIDSRKSS